MTPERAITAFWLACTEDGDMDGVALKDAMLKFATPPAAQQELEPSAWEDAFGEVSKVRDEQFKWPLYRPTEQQERKPDPLAPRGWRGSMNEKETP